MVLDTLPIEVGSVAASGAFTFEPSTRIFKANREDVDSVQVCYRVLSTMLTRPFFQRDIAQYEQTTRNASEIRFSPSTLEKEELFSFPGIQKFGAISRGISFGNRQNVLVNSSLNLQMSGKMDDNLFISAVVTDQDVPYQPEGNTQQIRDFDNVFIKLYNDRFHVLAGDIVLKDPDEGYFLRYYKNIQGLQAEVKSEGKWSSKTRLSGAIAKGKFYSATLEAIDGLSGPYRLSGPNGETFLIVLANSEKVFLDGKQMERGFDKDYIIDYNLGEITFNNHIIITQFSIIRVDFEYAEQNYSRSNISAYQSLSTENVQLHAQYYRERDNPNATFGFSLDEEEIDFLSSLGDNQDAAFLAGFDSVQYDESRVLYIRKDTVDQDGFRQSIFEYSTDDTAELYSPTFSEVGEGNGDYVLSDTTVNGRVYVWKSPVGGERQGSYQPGALVALPNSRQLMTLGGAVTLSSYEKVVGEVAFSQTDANLYSQLDDADNTSRAYYASLTSKGRSSFLPHYQWVGSLSVEYDERDFSFIDRYRPILFDRMWSVEADEVLTSDFLLFSKVGLRRDAFNQLIVEANHRKQEGLLNGWQGKLKFDQRRGKLNMNSSHFILSSQQANTSSQWVQTKSDVSYQIGKIVPGYIFEIDQNRLLEQDSVFSSLMHFKSHEWYVVNADSAKARYRFSYQSRKDKLPIEGEMRDYIASQNWQASYAHTTQSNRLMVNANYRRVSDQLAIYEGQSEVINGRLTWWNTLWKGHLTQNLSYATGNSRELQREYVFVPVNTGEGTHTWRDVNEDGVQELNEFFEAINVDERNYVKVFTFTDDYITAFQTLYTHSIDGKMPTRWRSRGFLLSQLSRFSAQINFNVHFKTTSEDYRSRLSPFAIDFDGETILSAKDTRRYTLFFNRNARGLAGDFTYQTTDVKQLLTQGFEYRDKEEIVSNLKMNLGKDYTLRLTATAEEQLNTSDFLDSRNFNIVTLSFSPQLIWMPTNHLRLIGSYVQKQNNNEFTEASEEFSLLRTVKGELTWNKASVGSLRGSFSVIQIDFEGDESTYLAYLLLDALQPGTNQTWQLNWQQKLSRGMRLSLLYNGRKSEGASAIHTGTVELTAYF